MVNHLPENDHQLERKEVPDIHSPSVTYYAFLTLILTLSVISSIIGFTSMGAILLKNPTFLWDTLSPIYVGLYMVAAVLNIVSAYGVLRWPKWGVVGLIIGVSTMMTIGSTKSFTAGSPSLLIQFIRNLIVLSILLSAFFWSYRKQFS